MYLGINIEETATIGTDMQYKLNALEFGKTQCVCRYKNYYKFSFLKRLKNGAARYLQFLSSFKFSLFRILWFGNV